MLECFRFGSHPIEPSSSAICLMELLYNGGAAPLEELSQLAISFGDSCGRVLLFASERDVGRSTEERILCLRTDMISKFSRSRYMRLRRRLSFTTFSCFLITLDLREIFWRSTCIMLIWQRPRECIFFRSFLALPGTLGALRFCTSFSVEAVVVLSYFRRCRHLRTSFG